MSASSCVDWIPPYANNSIVSPATAASSALLLTLKLLHLPSSRRLRLLQLLYSLRLLRTSLSGYCLLASLHDHLVQPPEAGIDIVRLLARVIGLNDELSGLGSVVPRAKDVLVEEIW